MPLVAHDQLLRHSFEPEPGPDDERHGEDNEEKPALHACSLGKCLGERKPVPKMATETGTRTGATALQRALC